MASEDKTYCGRGESDGNQTVVALADKLGLSQQDIFDVMEKVGPDLDQVEAYFKSKENSY